MADKKQILTVGQVIKDINTSLASSSLLKTQLMQSLVTEEPVNWTYEIASAFSSNDQVIAKTKEKLNISQTPGSNALQAAFRYHLINVNDDKRIYYGTYMELSDYEAYTLEQCAQEARLIFVEKQNIYRNYLPHSLSDSRIVDTQAQAGDALADFPEARLKGLEIEELTAPGVTLFQLQINGAVEDLAPYTDTIARSWTNTDSLFTINPTHDYHFGVDLNLVLICAEDVSGINTTTPREIDITDRSFSPTDKLGPLEISLYARLHNGSQDDSENLNKLTEDFPSFVKLSQANWLITDAQGNFYNRSLRLQGGLRIRSVIDDYLDSSFYNSSSNQENHPRFSHVDIIIAVRTKDKYTQGGPMLFRLTPLLDNQLNDYSNYIDVVDLGVTTLI